MADNIKIDYDRKLFDFEGEELKKPDEQCPTCRQPVGDGKTFTVRGILMSIARINPADDKEGKKALEAFHAGLKAAARDPMSAEDVTLLKGLLSRSNFDTLIKGQVMLALDQDSSPFEKKPAGKGKGK